MPTPRPQNVIIHISSLSIAKVLIVIAALAFLYLVKDIVAILFISLILASALSPAVSALQRRGIPRAGAILLIYAGIISVALLSIVTLIPALIEQSRELAESLPMYSDQITSFLRASLGESEAAVIAQVKEGIKSLETAMLQAAGGLFFKIFDIIGGLATVVVVAVITFYMMVEETMMKRALDALVPARYHDYTHQLVGRMQVKIGEWFRAQLILCGIIFLFSLVGLLILGVKYALLLALIAGMLEFIPLVGPIVSAIPAIFIAFGQSPWLALWVLLVYYLIQWTENHFLVPTVMRSAVGINPLISIIAILIGAKVGGLVGVILAIPIATVAGLIVGDFFGKEEDSEREEE